MINLDKEYLQVSEDIDAMNSWSEKMYNDTFASYFQVVHDLYNVFKTKKDKISDDQLEQVIVYLPLDLISASEKLSEFKSGIELIKLKYREQESQIMQVSEEKTVTAKKSEAELKMIEKKLLTIAYSAVISRVEGEISFAKELIMGCKKIWDARRNTDTVNPIKENVAYTSEDYERIKNESRYH